MSHSDWFTTSCDGLIGYVGSAYAVFDMIGWGGGGKHDVHMIRLRSSGRDSRGVKLYVTT